MSEQMRASEYKCPTCGRLDPFNQTIEDALRAEVERLQAELEKYVTPLTDEQAEHLASYHDNTAANWRYLDGEIRAAREGER